MSGLEHGLLFAEKRAAPAEIDISPFNGLYYRLKAVADRIEGTPFGVDLKRAIVEGGLQIPLRPRDLDPLDPPARGSPSGDRMTIVAVAAESPCMTTDLAKVVNGAPVGHEG